MKALVVGGGSIGTRHLKNLVRLGVENLAVCEPNRQRADQLADELRLVALATLPEGLEWNPDLVVLASPTHLHIHQALQVVRAGKHLFVEKPLAHVLDGLEELEREVLSRGLVTLVGCNMRFHPGPARVQELLAQGLLGPLLTARVQCGSYLPGWRPQSDYREQYSARADMGGGCILDCIHEIDLTRWYLGDVVEVQCMAGHLSSLSIDVEDVAALICRHSQGAISEIHLDYVQRSYQRTCQVVGEFGSIFWDYTAGTVRWFDARELGEWHQFTQPADWEVNQMYLDEMAHFLDCVRLGSPTTLSVPEAIKVVQIALGAKQSARTGSRVYLS